MNPFLFHMELLIFNCTYDFLKFVALYFNLKNWCKVIKGQRNICHHILQVGVQITSSGFQLYGSKVFFKAVFDPIIQLLRINIKEHFRAQAMTIKYRLLMKICNNNRKYMEKTFISREASIVCSLSDMIKYMYRKDLKLYACQNLKWLKNIYAHIDD